MRDTKSSPGAALRLIHRSIPLLLLAAGARAAEVGEGVFEALASSDRAPLLIELALPREPEPKALERAVNRVLSGLPEDAFLTTHRYRNLRFIAGQADLRAVNRLARHPGVTRIDLDATGSGRLNEALPLAGVSELAQVEGLTGSGITVAILDTGVDLDHPDFVSRVVAEQCFCSLGGGCCPGGGTMGGGAGAAEDDHGHGTNMAGILTGGGRVALPGAAPGAEIVAVKVADSNNRFRASDVIAGLDWLIDNRPEVDVVNMSLGTDITLPGPCDRALTFTRGFAEAVGLLRERGVLVTAPTGNQGVDGAMEVPACVGEVVSVGAVYDTNLGRVSGSVCSEDGRRGQVTCFSNAGPTTDLFAPGIFITTASLGGGIGDSAGTSAAAPMVAGCAALLREARPGATPFAMETAMKAAGTAVTDASSGLAHARLDCAAALAFLRGNRMLLERLERASELRRDWIGSPLP